MAALSLPIPPLLCRLPVHRLAAQVLLQELEEDKEKVEEKRVLALETSLSSGVVCSQTAYVGVNMELGKPVQGPLLHRDVPLPSELGAKDGGLIPVLNQMAVRFAAELLPIVWNFALWSFSLKSPIAPWILAAQQLAEQLAGIHSY